MENSVVEYKIAYFNIVGNVSFRCVNKLLMFLKSMLYDSDFYTVSKFGVVNELFVNAVGEENCDELLRFVKNCAGSSIESEYVWGIVNVEDRDDKNPVMLWVKIDEKVC